MGSEVYIALLFFSHQATTTISHTPKDLSSSLSPFHQFSCREPTFACILNFRL